MRIAAVALLLLCVAACSPFSPPPRPVPGGNSYVQIEFYLVHEAPSPDVTERRVETTGEVVFLASLPDLTERDIAWGALQTDPIMRRVSVLVHFTPLGADKLALLTRQNLGRRLAIAIDGKIISSPLIQQEIRDGRATIQGFRSMEQAQRVANALARR